MSAASAKKKKQNDAAKGLTRLELYAVHPEDRAKIKKVADQLKQERREK